jgi:hypothetical protein
VNLRSQGAACLRRLALGLVIVVLGVAPAGAQDSVDRLRDRGEGLPGDMFGTYIRRGELLAYPFFEYYRDNNYEYAPDDLGFVGAEDVRGRYRAKEGLIYLGYGVTDRIALELEVAVIDATLWKSPDDPSSVPARLTESGLGDTAAKIRWRWNRETDTRPEVFSFIETGFPLQRDRALIGTQEWEFAFGTGLVRGFSWGTLTVRGTVGMEGGALEPGEYAVEYLRRLSERLRIYGAIEGTQDEAELITEAQVFLTPNLFLKLNNAFGVTSKAPDWAPEIGVMFSIPMR